MRKGDLLDERENDARLRGDDARPTWRGGSDWLDERRKGELRAIERSWTTG